MAGRDPSWQADIGKAVRTGQIIVGALVGGCLFFLFILLVLAPTGMAGGNRDPLITWIALGFGALTVVLRLIVPGLVVSRTLGAIARGTYQLGLGQGRPVPNFERFIERTGDAGLLWTVYLTRTIVAGALLEGGAFFLLISYLLEGQLLALGAAIFLIVGIALLMPTRNSVIHWIEDRLRDVEMERQMAK